MHSSPLSTFIVLCGALVGLSGSAKAQQFTYQPGLIPGPAVWTEGVQAVDVDHDGDLDLCFANGDGFSGPGAQRQCGLVINRLIETGSLTFVDESVGRLGTFLANGKGVTAGDVNGDGWVDLLYLNAFNTDTPFLFINRGAIQPGFFDMESATRGFTENLSSAGAQFGDLDDDGDLDVIINDSGNSFLSGGGRPRLFFNDGAGNFTEDAAAMNAPLKAAHMDVQLVDLDGDWTVDFFGANRASNGGGNHYVMLNDGTGSFTDVSNLMAPTSSFVYEAEVGLLDGDLDVDLFFVSLSGFREGPVSNQVIENGSLGFTAGTPESGNVDDNEVALMDYDNDGDLDVFIASLGSRERLYRNDGGMNFVEQSSRIQAVSDSSLDMTVADLDNDGDYDLVTAQGESNSAQFISKAYLNSGPADSIAPTLVGLLVPASTIQWPVVLKVKYQDGASDDGVDYVVSTLLATPFLDSAASVNYSVGGFSHTNLAIVSGQSVVLTNSGGASGTFSAPGPTPFSINLGNGQSYEHVFVQPGVYSVTSSMGGTPLTITVTGNPSVLTGLPMGVGQHRFAVPQQGVSPFDVFSADLLLKDWAGNERWVQISAVDYPMGATEVYCTPAEVHSGGVAAQIDFTGSIAVADQDFGLIATNLPLNEFGFFLVGQLRGFIPNPGGSMGNLCLGGAIGRFNLGSQIGHSGASGNIAVSVDLSALPTNPNVAVMAGDTYCFQAWFRDTPVVGSNLTDGLSVTFR